MAIDDKLTTIRSTKKGDYTANLDDAQAQVRDVLWHRYGLKCDIADPTEREKIFSEYKVQPVRVGIRMEGVSISYGMRDDKKPINDGVSSVGGSAPAVVYKVK